MKKTILFLFIMVMSLVCTEVYSLGYYTGRIMNTQYLKVMYSSPDDTVNLYVDPYQSPGIILDGTLPSIPAPKIIYIYGVHKNSIVLLLFAIAFNRPIYVIVRDDNFYITQITLR